MDEMWGSFFGRNLDAVDGFTQAERDQIVAKIEANPDSVTYIRNDGGWVEVYAASKLVARVHLF